MALDYILYLLLNPFKFKSFPKNVKKILIVELLAIGDLLVITPALRALKNKFPEATIDLLVAPRMKEVLKGNRNINEIIPYEGNKSVVSRLKRKEYDLGIIFHNGSLNVSRLLLKTKVKYRVGCTPDVGITYGKGFFLNRKVEPNFTWQHKIDDNLLVVKSLGAEITDRKMEVHATTKAKENVKKVLKKKKVKKSDYLVIIHPGSQYTTQQWYPEKFAEVADAIIKKYKAKVVFTGATDQKQQVKDIQKRMKHKSIDLTGKTTLQEYIAIVEQADLIVSIDTSIIHIASALNKPIVTVFGPTLPERWGPTSKKSIAVQNRNVCTGCRRYQCIINTHECMKSISTDQVITAISTLKK